MKSYRKQKIVVAWILALISALPILFIVWLSVLPADDINQFVFFPQNRDNRVTFLAAKENSRTEIAATSLGHIYENGEKITDIKSVATVYSQDKSLWAFSANRGLIEIDIKRKTEKNSYDWNFFKENYKNFDPTRFYVSSDILSENFIWLANKLNNEPALPEYGVSTVSSLIGVKFYPSEEIIGQLNWILANDKTLNSILGYWKKWDGWLNPQIHNLFKIQKPTEKEKHLLFRFCLSELFPNKISRMRYFLWQDIWVSQIANSGLSVLAAEDKVIMGIRGGFFPGIAIFDTESKQLSWITEATGLPSASIQNIIQISNREILAVHDMGFSIIQFDAGKIIRNFIFGEYGLPYLDEQNLHIKALPGNKISISHGTGSLIFDLNKFATELTQEQTTLSPLISSYPIPKGNRSLQLSNYQDIMRIMPLGSFIKNSMLISIVVSILCTIFAILPSYAIARLQFFGKFTFTKIMLSSQVLSSLPFLIPIFVIFIILQMKSFHIFNSFFTIIFVNTAFFLPLTVQFMFNMFKAIPSDLEESAVMDGCSPWQTFWKVIIPAIRPALATCLIYVFLFVWDEILFIWILSTDSSTATLPVGIRMAVGQMANRPELLMAFSVIASLPPMILFAFVQPFFLKSLVRNR